ncbi:polysaccharide deacetylase family protein [Nodularia spumigena CS-588/02]|uniref:polysaccharide deacetylase family protein n=1 Tax=Nodularia spumigena TaxID=70799 RepID=UPI00232D52D0|nr:polysaccharide deacetylase family protein [Nodularia spumigena]MDB9359115.1 polysaccharide deacetylase family protein [Nodularia spumigena CS-588/02]MDB9365608.1 polysaccharide deacetylase family protein [Nodularia spumigena CS-588/02A10]
MQLAPLFPFFYRILQPSFPDCLWSGNRYNKAIALTFDDGPHPEYTPQVLAVLDRYNIQASFFWLGACVNRYPAIAKAICDRGHWIGLHGYDHRSFPTLSPNDLQDSLAKTQIAIYNACDLTPEQVCDVRPPNGLFTPQTLKLFLKWNYRPVMWSIVPEDWVRPGVTTVVQRVLKQVQNGSLIVLHDGTCGGQDVAAIIGILIPQLLQQGYEFVTVDTLWQQNQTKRHFTASHAK